jgi:hypothetical protein
MSWYGGIQPPKPVSCVRPSDTRGTPELHDELHAALGTFPLFHFWGPGADLVSSQ